MKFNFNNQYCTVSDASKQQKPQIYTAKEFAVFHAFSDANFTDLKSMMEGESVNVSTNKYVKFEEMFADGFFIVATNKLPKMANPDFYNHYEQWVPLQRRFEMVEFEDAHEGTIEFPYTTEEFALALMFVKNLKDDDPYL